MSYTPMAKRRSVFISCATEDIQIARLFRLAINQLPGFYGYIARDEPKVFEYPSEKIATELEKCEAYIILCSRNGIASPMVNQELGFFYHRYRTMWGIKPLILPIQSVFIEGNIDGFVYGRETIPLDPNIPDNAIGLVLWELKNKYNINIFEIQCGDHFTNLRWPAVELVNDCNKNNVRIQYSCGACQKEIYVNPLTLLQE